MIHYLVLELLFKDSSKCDMLVLGELNKKIQCSHTACIAYRIGISLSTSNMLNIFFCKDSIVIKLKTIILL